MNNQEKLFSQEDFSSLNEEQLEAVIGAGGGCCSKPATDSPPDSPRLSSFDRRETMLKVGEEMDKAAKMPDWNQGKIGYKIGSLSPHTMSNVAFKAAKKRLDELDRKAAEPGTSTQV
jgi:hypothetical protein